MPVDFLSVYRREVIIIGNISVDHLQEEMAQELMSMCKGFESGALVPIKESAMNFISLQEAIEGYANGKKNCVIKFD